MKCFSGANTAKTNSVYIPSLDGKDIYLANHYKDRSMVGYNLKNKKGYWNLSKFINTLDYSLDLIKLREIFAEQYPHDRFSFFDNHKEYTPHVINVTFKYSVKEFNRIGDCYVRNGYNFNELDFDDGIVFDEAMELVGICIGKAVERPVSNYVLEPYFKYNADSKSYQIKKDIPTLYSLSDIRDSLYQDGFICNGIKYIRFKRSSGSSRVGKCLFINADLYDKIHKWEMCGIHVDYGQDVDLAALEPYIALTLSSIIDTIQIKAKNILVIPDFESRFYEKVIATRLVNGRLSSKPEYVEIKNKIWDGQSLMDKSLFGKYEDKGMLLLRSRFFKSCCFNANIQQWFKDCGVTDVEMLTRAGGRTVAKNIEDIKLITTPSSIKYLKFGSLDAWLATLDTRFGVVKYEKPSKYFGGRMVQTHYQLINTLQLSQAEIAQLLKPSLEYMKRIKTDPAFLRHHIGYQYEIPDETDASIACKNDIIYRLLSVNDKFADTKIYRDFCNTTVKAFTKQLRQGHVLVRGNYSTLCGNPIEMLKAAIGEFHNDSIIEVGTIHSEMFDDGRELLGSRSPHVTMGNILLTRNVIRDEIRKYMNPTKEIVYVNSINENLLERLSGSDFDSDSLLLTDNEILINAARRNYDKFPVPTKFVDSIMLKRKYTNSDKADLDIKTSVNKIGEIINLSQELNSILWDRVNRGASIDDVMELYCDISQLDVMSNLEIDSAKRENPANNVFELKALKKKYDVRDEKNRHVRPLFFRYLDDYKGYRDNYCVYQEDLSCEDGIRKIDDVCSLSQAKAIREQLEQDSQNKIHIEKGRMSYRKYKTAMDYLQLEISKFRAPQVRRKEPLFYVLSDVYCEDDYKPEVEGQIIQSIKSAKDAINCVFAKNHYEWFPARKHDVASELRISCIKELQNISVNQATMKHLLENLETEYKEIAQFAFYVLLDEFNYQMKGKIWRLLIDSCSPVEVLSEADDGDFQIYDFYYRKEIMEMPYENQDEFRLMVLDFIKTTKLKKKFVATVAGVSDVFISQYLHCKRGLSREKRKKLYLFMTDYKETQKVLK